MLYYGMRIDPAAQQIMSAMKKDGEEEYGENENSVSDLSNDDDATYDPNHRSDTKSKIYSTLSIYSAS